MIPKVVENFNFRFLNKAKLYFTFGGEKPKSDLDGKYIYEEAVASTSPAEEYDSDEDGINVTDKRISCLSLCVSLAILIGFIISRNTDVILSMFASLGAITTKLVVQLLSWGWLLVPLACGILASAVTWYIVYMDSHTPGIFPPSPLSPSRSKRKGIQGRQCHSNYIFAIAVGPIIGFFVHYNFYM